MLDSSLEIEADASSGMELELDECRVDLEVDSVTRPGIGSSSPGRRLSTYLKTNSHRIRAAGVVQLTEKIRFGTKNTAPIGQDMGEQPIDLRSESLIAWCG